MVIDWLKVKRKQENTVWIYNDYWFVVYDWIHNMAQYIFFDVYLNAFFSLWYGKGKKKIKLMLFGHAHVTKKKLYIYRNNFVYNIFFYFSCKCVDNDYDYV